jgi:hypothetical protein
MTQKMSVQNGFGTARRNNSGKDSAAVSSQRDLSQDLSAYMEEALQAHVEELAPQVHPGPQIRRRAHHGIDELEDSDAEI